MCPYVSMNSMLIMCLVNVVGILMNYSYEIMLCLLANPTYEQDV